MSSQPAHALILFAHGARDARWARTLAELREAVRRKQPGSLVSLAFLEFQQPTLLEALEDAAATGCTQIDVAPVFWAAGGHVINDMPPLLERFRDGHPRVQLTLLPVLSELPGMTDFIATALDALTHAPVQGASKVSPT